VVTASLAVVDVLRDSLETELIVLGGVLRNSYLSLVGGITELALQQISADVAVLGASGVSNQGFVLDTTGIEVPIKKAIMAASDRNIFVLAEDKFPGTGVLQICHPGEVDTIVTTRREPSAGLEQLRAHAGKVVIA
jgi:DeoR/GlpR family transcriptional regulator of sugar metabolism